MIQKHAKSKLDSLLPQLPKKTQKNNKKLLHKEREFLYKNK